jgi:FAD/FMN-containing dehydrogenase
MLRSLRERMRGTVLTADDAGYDEARKVWNGRFDRRPAAIARCIGAGDVAAALEIARRSGLPLAVRSGGHDYAGNSMCD